MSKETIAEAKGAMAKTLEALQAELQKIRTGRAHPTLLEHVEVVYYGNAVPLNQVANVAAEDARTLTVSPWEQAMVPTVEKALRTCDLGVNPVTAGQVIRVPLPPLTEARRREYVKLVKEAGERSRVSVRNARRDANQNFKDALKEKVITEDEERQSVTQIQQLTDQFIEKIDAVLAEKEKELLAV